MKVESISIQDFKIFSRYTVHFKNRSIDEISDRFALIGDNGSGKTTLLQAIAFTLWRAMFRSNNIEAFDWVGFLPQRLTSRNGNMVRPHIELDIVFSDDEIDATIEVAERWRIAQDTSFWIGRNYVQPGRSRHVHLVLDGTNITGLSFENLLQFRGRFMASWLINTGADPSVRSIFSRLPGIFYFDQFRNLNSTNVIDNEIQEPSIRAYNQGVGQLREYLVKWYTAQNTRYVQYNYLSSIERLYQHIFPDRSFAGIEPMPGFETKQGGFFFLLSDGENTYDIAEMSSGEQAVFPIIYEFVRMNIGNSVVLIDEIDMHLHPPAAQSFVNALYRIGPTCQFIFSTHSEAVSSLISSDEIHRIQRGVVCL